MATLSKELRKALERAVLVARDIAEKGAAEAVEMFPVEVEHYSRSANAHDNLGEAHLTEGNTAAAFESSERCLDLESGVKLKPSRPR